MCVGDGRRVGKMGTGEEERERGLDKLCSRGQVQHYIFSEDLHFGLVRLKGQPRQKTKTKRKKKNKNKHTQTKKQKHTHINQKTKTSK